LRASWAREHFPSISHGARSVNTVRKRARLICLAIAPGQRARWDQYCKEGVAVGVGARGVAVGGAVGIGAAVVGVGVAPPLGCVVDGVGAVGELACAVASGVMGVMGVNAMVAM
jgi:hypothetical protein